MFDSHDPRAIELDHRESALLDKHGGNWCRPLKELELEPNSYGGYYPFLWFERGMIAKVTIDKRDAVPGKLTRLFELTPTLSANAAAPTGLASRQIALSPWPKPLVFPTAAGFPANELTFGKVGHQTSTPTILAER